MNTHAHNLHNFDAKKKARTKSLFIRNHEEAMVGNCDQASFSNISENDDHFVISKVWRKHLGLREDL